jgi:hypothetical protein
MRKSGKTVKGIPIRAAKEIAEKYSVKQVILVTWDGESECVTTYGKTVEECEQAAIGGNRIKKALGWPDSYRTEPLYIEKLRKEIKSLKAQLDIAIKETF